MDPKFVPSKIIESAPVGPLYTYIEPYIAFVSELGFAPRSVYEQIRVIVMFSRSLLRSGCKIRDLKESVTERFLHDELRERWPHVAAPATLRRLLVLLRRMGVVAGKPAPKRSPAQRLTDDYRHFLLTERALSPATVDAWVRFIEKFLCELFGANTLKLSKLRPIDVTAFVQRHARRHSPSHARKLVTGMRSFLRYLRYQGLVEVDLDKAVPRVAQWSLSDLAKSCQSRSKPRSVTIGGKSEFCYIGRGNTSRGMNTKSQHELAVRLLKKFGVDYIRLEPATDGYRFVAWSLVPNNGNVSLPGKKSGRIKVK